MRPRCCPAVTGPTSEWMPNAAVVQATSSVAYFGGCGVGHSLLVLAI